MIRVQGWATALLVGVMTTGCTSDESTSSGVTKAAVSSDGTIIGVASNRCLDVRGNSTAPGSIVQIYDCHGGANQKFSFTSAGELRTFGGAACVVTGSGKTAGGGTPVVIGNCTGDGKQKWQLNANQTIVEQNSGLCLDVMNASNDNRTPTQLWQCNGQTNQKWRATAADTQAPTPPGNLQLGNVTCDATTLSWSASTDNVGVAYYDVYHDGQLLTSVDGATLTATVGVVAGVKWGFYVNARDAAGNVSQASSTVYSTPPQCQVDTQPPTAPTNLGGTVSGTSVSLSWGASSDNVRVAAYDIYRNGAKVGSITGTVAVPPSTSFVDSGLAANTSYAYYVVARDPQSNVSAHSNTVTLVSGQSCTSAVCGTTQVGADTDIPWGLANLPDGSILFNERDAHNVVRLDPATGNKTIVGTIPNVDETDGEGGLLGLALSPSFGSDHWLYIMHTSPSDNRIVRVKYLNNAVDNSTLQVLVSGILRNKFHNGGRLRFGPDGKLYASTGDAQNGANAQNTSGLNGKVLRINADGTVPSDNPFHNYVWSYGHRNPQGLAFDSQGRLWEQEFGNSTMDETNLIQKGGNYGWPDCEGTVSQSGGGCGTAGFIAPKYTYSTADGSCSGIAIVSDVIYVACERGTRMYREVISGSALTNVQQFFVGTFGRLRTVEPAPDGNLWLTTTNLGDKDSIANNSDEKIFKVLLGH